MHAVGGQQQNRREVYNQLSNWQMLLRHFYIKIVFYFCNAVHSPAKKEAFFCSASKGDCWFMCWRWSLQRSSRTLCLDWEKKREMPTSPCLDDKTIKNPVCLLLYVLHPWFWHEIKNQPHSTLKGAVESHQPFQGGAFLFFTVRRRCYVQAAQVFQRILFYRLYILSVLNVRFNQKHNYYVVLLRFYQ